MIRLLTLLLLSAGALSAQPAHWLNFSSGKNVNGIAFEGDTAWIATRAGLIRYDVATGQRRVFNRANSTIPINAVLAVAVDTGGAYWVGTPLGLSHFDGQTFSAPFSPLAPDALYANREIHQIAVLPNGDMWIRIRWGHTTPILQYSNQAWTNVPKVVLHTDDDLDMLPGKNNDMWLLNKTTTPHRVYRYRDGVAEQVYTANLPGFNVQGWHCDTAGNLWVFDGSSFLKFDGTNWSGLSVTGQNIYSAEKFALAPDGTFWISNYSSIRRWTTLTPAEEYYCYEQLDFHDDLKDIFLAPDGSVWCPTDASGIIRATPDGQLSSLQPLEKDLRSNNVDRIRISGQQDIWAACDAYPADLYPDWNNNSGFSRYNDGPWDDFYWLDILPGNHKAPYNSKGLALDQAGHPWVASFHGISGYDGAQWIQYPVPGGDTAYINSIATDPSDGRVWAGGIGKIYRQAGNVFLPVNHPVPGYVVQQIEVDQQGGVWTASWGANPSVWRYDQQNWTPYDTAAMHLHDYDHNIRKLSRTMDGKIWAFANYGVASFDGVQWTGYEYDNTPEFVHIPYVNAVTVDHDGNTWFGYFLQHCTETPDALFGLTKFKDGEWTWYPFETTALPWPNVTDMTVDSANNIWIATESAGIAVFNEQQIVLGAQPPAGAGAGLSVLPNPASARVCLTLNSWPDGRPAEARVFDLAGRLIATTGFSSGKAWLDISAWPPGWYFAAATAGGKPLGVQKLIKH